MEGVSIDWPQFWILGYVAFAMLLGAIIGLDREIARKPAGLRTHMLVAGAATLFVSLGNLTVEQFNAELGGQIIRSESDPRHRSGDYWCKLSRHRHHSPSWFHAVS